MKLQSLIAIFVLYLHDKNCSSSKSALKVISSQSMVLDNADNRPNSSIFGQLFPVISEQQERIVLESHYDNFVGLSLN